VSESSVEVRDLVSGNTYRFYVQAHNENGSSLPSSVILVNVSSSGKVNKQKRLQSVFKFGANVLVDGFSLISTCSL